MVRTLLATAILSATTLGAQAAPLFVDSLANQGYNVIMGTGIGDGGFTFGTSTDGGISVALRARERYPSPTNNTGLQSVGVYQQSAGSYNGGLAAWNFDWSIAIGNATQTLGAYTYKLGIDYNGTSAMTFLEFNPVNGGVLYDNAFGDTGSKAAFPATPKDGGVTYKDFPNWDPAVWYASAVDSQVGYDLVQNSWNLGFFDSPASPFSFDPSADGSYSIFLQVLNEEEIVAESRILVNVVGAVNPVPEPGTLALAGVAFAGLALVRRRKSNKS